MQILWLHYSTNIRFELLSTFYKMTSTVYNHFSFLFSLLNWPKVAMWRKKIDYTRWHWKCITYVHFQTQAVLLLSRVSVSSKHVWTSLIIQFLFFSLSFAYRFFQRRETWNVTVLINQMTMKMLHIIYNICSVRNCNLPLPRLGQLSSFPKWLGQVWLNI